MKKLIIAVALLCFSNSVVHAKVHSKGKPHKQPPHVDYQQYDSEFKKWNTFYRVFDDYRLLKSICITESRLNAKAISKDGSMGLCQFTRQTWQRIQKRVKELPINGYYNPQHSIHAAAYYLSELKHHFSNHSDIDSLVLASYNAGIGNIKKSLLKCNVKKLPWR